MTPQGRQAARGTARAAVRHPGVGDRLHPVWQVLPSPSRAVIRGPLGALLQACWPPHSSPVLHPAARAAARVRPGRAGGIQKAASRQEFPWARGEAGRAAQREAAQPPHSAGTAHVPPVDWESLRVGRGLALCFLGGSIKNWDLEILKFRSQCLGQLRASGERAGLETPFRSHQQMEAIQSHETRSHTLGGSADRKRGGPGRARRPASSSQGGERAGPWARDAAPHEAEIKQDNATA